MLLHATCIALQGQGVLLAGKPGVGKSDLALRLIDGGALLVADDQTLLTKAGDRVMASAPSSIKGLLEVRHVGLFHFPVMDEVPIALYIDLVERGETLERLPEGQNKILLDQPVRWLRLRGDEASAPAKIKAALFAQALSENG